MPVLRASCPSCGATLRVTNLALAGKTVNCPKCSEPLILPAPEDEPDDAGTRPLPGPGGPGRVADDDADDRPRRRKRSKKPAAGGGSMTRTLVASGLLVVLVAAAAVIWFNRSKTKETADAGASPSGAGDTPAPREEPPARGPADDNTDAGAGGPDPASRAELPTGRPAAGPAAAPGETALPYDRSKLSYDPTRPELTIPAGQWPRRSSRGDTSLTAYDGKVIATEGRIVGFYGSDRPAKPGDRPGPIRFHVYLFDTGGRIFGPDGRGVFASVFFSEGTDWKRLRPGQVVKAVGVARTPKDAPTSLSLYDAVAITVRGDGDPPVTTDQLLADLAKDPKPYRGGFTSDRFFTLTGTVGDIPALSANLFPYLFLAHGTFRVRYTVTNLADYYANPPKPGDPITLIGRVTDYKPFEKQVTIEGLYLPK
jgi:predicted Zn finger-like uncharacterized protein